LRKISDSINTVRCGGYESKKKNIIPAKVNKSGYRNKKARMIPQEARQQQLRKYKEAAAWMHY